jgi:glycosyltransferase involved in cell wall biosynthesis
MLKHWDKEIFQTVILSSSLARDRVVPDVPVRYLPPSKHFDFYPLTQIRHLSLIGRQLKIDHPDIVHTYFFWSILYGRLLKWAGKIKILVENREDMGFDWGQHEYLWLRMTRSLPDKIICVSEAVKKVVLEREGVEESRIAVINNGVDLNQAKTGMQAETRRELGFKEDHLVLGMVANYNRSVKGVANFLNAIPAIVSSVPFARFLFVGGGNEENALLEKVKTLGIGTYVVFAGYRKDIHRYYEIMDISVLTSFSEGLSLTLLESMSHGIPVVATEVGGNPEVVADGQTGYLVPVNDTRILVDRIVELLKNQDVRRRMGNEGRRCIERKFRMRDVASRYIEIYKGLMPDRFEICHPQR